MNAPTDPSTDAADARRFALRVWPQTPERGWHAEISGAGTSAPIGFDRPVDLVLYLIELSRTPTWQPRGLR